MIKLSLARTLANHHGGFIDDPHENFANFQKTVSLIHCSSLMSGVAQNILAILAQNGYVLLDTDVRDFAPSTPTASGARYAGPFYGEAILAIFAGLIGEIQSISHQNSGKLFHDIIPLAESALQQTSASSEVTLEMHTELAFVNDPPDYLMLFCVREDREREAETHLFDAALAFDHLHEGQAEELMKRQFFFGLDANLTSSVDDCGGPYPILDAASRRLLRFDLDLYRAIGSAGDDAFAALRDALLTVRIAVRLRAGQLLIIDNKRIVHSRSRFAPSYNGEDRWLKRSLVRRY